MTTESDVFGERLPELFAFIRERHLIYERREAGQPKPWTEDPILQRYRFCNAYRNNDAVTKWVHQNWLQPNAEDPDVWFAMVIARFFNLPDTLEEIGYPVPFEPEKMLAVLLARKARGQKNFNAAYMIRSKAGCKATHLVQDVFAPMWAQRGMLRPKAGDSLATYHFVLGQFYGLGSFLTAQVIADLKEVYPLRTAPDHDTFAAPGPGSMRGLNRMLGRSPETPWKGDEWRLSLNRLREALLPYYDAAGMPRPCAQDVQNIGCCEWDKFKRAQEGGRPKQLYQGC